MISTGGESLFENIAGEGAASGIITLSKSAINFKNAVEATLKQIYKGADVVYTISTLIDTYGGIDNFNKARENFEKEYNEYMKSKKAEKSE